MPRSGSSSEAVSSGGLANLDLTPSTVSSTFDLRAYPSTSSLPIPSYSHIQSASAQQFRSPLAQTGSQRNTYPMPLNWSPSSTFLIDPAMDLRTNHYPEPPIRQHSTTSLFFRTFIISRTLLHGSNLDRNFNQTRGASWRIPVAELESIPRSRATQSTTEHYNPLQLYSAHSRPTLRRTLVVNLVY